MASKQRPARKAAPPAQRKPAAKAPARAKAAAKPARPATKTGARTVSKPAPTPKATKAAPPAKAAKVAQPAKSAQPAKAAKPTTRPAAKAAPPARKEPARKEPARPAPAAKTTARPAARPKGGGDGSTPIHGIPPYQPTQGERYMNERQLEHFRQILLAWKRELMEEVDRTVHHMQDEASNFPDPNDRATQESEFGLELRTRDRERKLLKKIDSALQRIDDGSYGFCEETGEEIGLKRLEARPVATLSLEAQERRELAERQYGERDDRFR
jgi:DnaK suppressor protein